VARRNSAVPGCRSLRSEDLSFVPTAPARSCPHSGGAPSFAQAIPPTALPFLHLAVARSDAQPDALTGSRTLLSVWIGGWPTEDRCSRISDRRASHCQPTATYPASKTVRGSAADGTQNSQPLRRRAVAAERLEYGGCADPSCDRATRLARQDLALRFAESHARSARRLLVNDSRRSLGVAGEFDSSISDTRSPDELRRQPCPRYCSTSPRAAPTGRTRRRRNSLDDCVSSGSHHVTRRSIAHDSYRRLASRRSPVHTGPTKESPCSPSAGCASARVQTWRSWGWQRYVRFAAGGAPVTDRPMHRGLESAPGRAS